MARGDQYTPKTELDGTEKITIFSGEETHSNTAQDIADLALDADEREALLGGGNTDFHKHTHNVLSGLNNGDYKHLTEAHFLGLTGGTATKLHNHNDFNVETIAATKILQETDAVIQLLTPSGASRAVTLPATANAGRKFYIVNNALYNTTFDLTTNYVGFPFGQTPAGGVWSVTPANGIELLFTGTSWILVNEFAISGFGFVRGNAKGVGGIGIGWGANAGSGVAIGSAATAGFVAIGSNSRAGTNGVNIAATNGSGATDATAVGSLASVVGASVAYGRSSNAKKSYSVALGAQAVAERFNEIAKTFSEVGGKRHLLFEGAQYVTNDATPRNLTLYYNNGASERLTVFASSMISFDFILNALDTGALGFKSWKIQGTIIRGATGNVSLLAAITPQLLGETGVYDTTFDTANWLVSVSADTTNNALQVQVTGEVGKTINWFMTGWANENRI
jgi:hypothetical protein